MQLAGDCGHLLLEETGEKAASLLYARVRFSEGGHRKISSSDDQHEEQRRNLQIPSSTRNPPGSIGRHLLFNTRNTQLAGISSNDDEPSAKKKQAVHMPYAKMDTFKQTVRGMQPSRGTAGRHTLLTTIFGRRLFSQECACKPAVVGSCRC